MRINKIRAMIDAAIEDEERSGRLAGTVRTVARNNGGNPTKKQVKEIVGFVRQYVEQVPHYLGQSVGEARKIGLGNQMNQMASQLEDYWFETDDLIPDHLGLMGLMDDAYATLLLLQSLSEYCQATVGRALVAGDLTPANQMIRLLIGEPAASNLDQRVGATLGQALMPQLASQLAVGGFWLGGASERDWGGVSLDEYVDIQLGAMGVV